MDVAWILERRYGDDVYFSNPVHGGLSRAGVDHSLNSPFLSSEPRIANSFTLGAARARAETQNKWRPGGRHDHLRIATGSPDTCGAKVRG